MGGAWLFFIPLTDLFMRGVFGVVMHMGIGGVVGVLIGTVMATCGLLLWYHPEHRTFYAVTGVVAAVLSFPGSNMGGFMLTLLLGIIGGSLAFGWTECTPTPADGRSRRTDRTVEAGGISVVVAMSMVLGPALVAGPVEPGVLAESTPDRVCSRPLVCAERLAGPSPDPVTVPERPLPSRLVLPEEDPPGVPLPRPSVPESGTSPDLPGVPDLLPEVERPALPVDPPEAPLAGRQPKHENKKPRRAGVTEGIHAYDARVELLAGAADVSGFAYQGVAEVPTADGRKVEMMKFIATSFTASGGVSGTIVKGGNSTVLESPSLEFRDNIVIYATELAGTLMGVRITMTPDSVEAVLMERLNTLTPSFPITMTDVVASQPILLADSMVGNLAVAAS